MSSEAWTIRRVLDWTAKDFRARGLESPRLDAELLVGHALGLGRVELVTRSEQSLADAELLTIREFVRRRRRREPVAYIVGQREFRGLPFRVDKRVLVPRPDTETLVDVALSTTQARSEFGAALDLCTGSGCVAIAFKKLRPTWHVTASDIAEEALAVARFNAERVGTSFGMRFVCSDLFAKLEDDAPFSLITANPPYIPSQELPTLMADVREFEPELALHGGNDGLDVVRRIVRGAPAQLGHDGVLALEVGHDQAARVSELFKAAGFHDVATARDYGGHERVVSGRFGDRDVAR